MCVCRKNMKVLLVCVCVCVCVCVVGTFVCSVPSQLPFHPSLPPSLPPSSLPPSLLTSLPTPQKAWVQEQTSARLQLQLADKERELAAVKYSLKEVCCIEWGEGGGGYDHTHMHAHIRKQAYVSNVLWL